MGAPGPDLGFMLEKPPMSWPNNRSVGARKLAEAGLPSTAVSATADEERGFRRVSWKPSSPHSLSRWC